MSLFGRKKPTMFTVGLKSDGIDAETEESVDAVMQKLESNLEESEQKFKLDKSYGLQLAKKYATLALYYKGRDDIEKFKKYRKRAIEIMDELPDQKSDNLKEIRDLIKRLK